MKNMIWKAEILSENRTKLRIELPNGEVVEGYSMGIELATDDEGEELDYEELVLEVDFQKAYVRLKNEDIISVTKAP